ncbi:MAG: histidinol dehydrogenase [Clostridia bacterium]|nr:histidinol dehydrogenase [Clostridia bacterium]
MKIYKGFEKEAADILEQRFKKTNVAEIVSGVIANVIENGDRAVLEYTEKFDKVRLDSLRVSEDEIAQAFKSIDPEFIRVLERAAENIREFHSAQVRDGFALKNRPGVVLGQKVLPLERVGIYVPGGTAAYPSTVLMNTIPAKIAGVKDIYIVSPPGPDGKVKPEIVAAAKVAGADAIFKVGGAQAVAALAYGTETIPKVDKIVGPGNAFVAEAKRQVFGKVAIDMIAGPSEILVIADGKASPEIIAADLLSQAEHDRLAASILLTTSEDVAQKTVKAVNEQLEKLPRKEIAGASIENNCIICVCGDLGEAIEIANEIAPEHLELLVDNPFDYLDDIKNAGSVFLGRNCPEALGDYMAGPNHTLPTGGTARFSSPLSVDDFVKKMQFSYFSDEALDGLYEDVAYFARQEGLEAHARSAEIRSKIKR